MTRSLGKILAELLTAVLVFAVFILPLLFVFFMAGKTKLEASDMAFTFPAHPQYGQNLLDVVKASNFMLLRAFWNSLVVTVFSIAVLVGVSAMAGYVLERRKSKLMSVLSVLILVGLMIPPSVITTIWVMQGIGLYKTLVGLIAVEVALAFPFSVLLYRAFMVTVPKEMDEAAMMEGANPRQLFVRIIFPLLKSVSATIIVLSSVNIFNDFVNPLYFLPGAKNVTVQLTLYNFMTQYSTQWNLLFTNVLLVTVPPLVCFLFFNRQIVAGMTAGAVKG